MNNLILICKVQKNIFKKSEKHLGMGLCMFKVAREIEKIPVKLLMNN